MTDSRHITGEESASASPSRKRTLPCGSFVKAVANVVSSSHVLLVALVRPKIPAALREKVFLGVTSITDCRYCRWGHTHWALARGVPLEEVNQILRQQIESLEAKNPGRSSRHPVRSTLRGESRPVRSGIARKLAPVLQRGPSSRDLGLRSCHHVRQPDRQHRGRHSRPLPSTQEGHTCLRSLCMARN